MSNTNRSLDVITLLDYNNEDDNIVSVVKLISLNYYKDNRERLLL